MRSFKAKGTSFHQKELADLGAGTNHTAALVPEFDNPHDGWAMAIYVNGARVGYAPRGWHQEVYGRWIVQVLREDEGVVSARVIGGYEMVGGKTALYGLQVVLTGSHRHRWKFETMVSDPAAPYYADEYEYTAALDQCRCGATYRYAGLGEAEIIEPT